MRISMTILIMALFLVGCETIPSEDPLKAFHQTRPHSILIVPAANNSVDVMAGTSVLTTLPKILGEKGYYVFPVNTVKTLLEYEGFDDAQQIHDTPTQSLAELFHADSILYVTIHNWTSEYILVSTTTIVDLEYVLTDREGNVIFSDRRQASYTPESESSGDLLSNIIASAITAAIERAAPNYLPLTREANSSVFLNSHTPLPPGPYHPNYENYYLELEAPSSN